jgi:hypothetical protein
MKPNQQSENSDEQLRSALREWVVDTPLPPRFQEQVWKRIARTEARPTVGLWTAFSRWLDAALPRPKVAFAYIAALMILGVAAGSVTAQVKSSQLRAALGERYVQSIDPYRAEIPRQ